MNTDINFQDFKCRCSRIGDMMSDSKDSPALTEKQEQELKDLEKKGDSLTAVQSVRLAELIAKKDKNLNGDISDSHAQYLLEVYAYKFRRRKFYKTLANKKPELAVFLKGWLNRVDNCKL